MERKNLTRYAKPLILVCVILLSSCTEDESIENSIQEEVSETVKIATQSSGEDDIPSAIVAEMKSLSDELYKVSTGKEPKHNNEKTNAAYYSSNSGSIYKKLNFTNRNHLRDNLYFGDRIAEHTTQWVALELTDVIGIRDVGVGAENNTGRGRVRFYLSGIGESVTLNYKVNPGPTGSFSRTVTLTPSSSASFLRNNIAPSPINIKLTDHEKPIKLTIHANEFGWLWLRIEWDGLIKYDQHYRFNYSQNLDSRNGGSISMSGYDMVNGPFIPYTVFFAHQSYKGYCGWFKE